MTPLPLFPLPALILYPGALVPLHLFEPRYRRLMRDLLEAGGREMVMGSLLPGWKDDQFGLPPVAEVAGLGRVVEVREDAEGCFDILLQGMSRVRLVEETMSTPPAGELPYRRVVVEALDEETLAADAAPGVHAALLEQLGRLAEELPRELLAADVNRLTDLLLVHAPLGLEERLDLFAELTPRARAERLLLALESRQAVGGVAAD
ncbi:MAG: LON peptidase substrate-binding domain-containing protein [Planctomycetota bacterium]|jgi:Lon protease-like protein